MNHWVLILAFLISLVLGASLTPWLVKWCILKDWTDQPNHRKVHAQPVPRLGGLMFLPCMAISFIISNLINNLTQGEDFTIHFSTLCMGIGALSIYLVGLVDDVNELKANTKFVVQLAAALIFPLCNLLISDLHGFLGIRELPFFISYPFTVFVILLITNAMNLIDGIDGLASGLSILIIGSFAYLFADMGAYNFTIIALSTLGALIAFFCYNVWGKVGGNKIFMGDSGSLFLGYIISYLAIKYQMTDDRVFVYNESSLLTSFTLVIIPTFDVIRVAITRKLNGLDMFTADKRHIHHRFMAMGLSMRQTLVSILTMFALLCGLNYCLWGMAIPMGYIVLCDVLFYSLSIGLTSLVKK